MPDDNPNTIDLNDPQLVGEALEVNAEGDPFAPPPPPPDGDYEVQAEPMDAKKWSQYHAKDGKRFLNGRLSLKIIKPGDKIDGQYLFDNVSTMVMQNTGASRVSGLLKLAGANMSGLATDLDWARAMTDMTKGLPHFKATSQWQAACADCRAQAKKDDKRYKPFLKGMNRFEQNGHGQHKHIVSCPECGAEVQAQAVVIRYQKVGQ